MTRGAALAAGVALLLGTTACENVQLAPGDVNDIYVIADPQLWSQVEDTVDAVLQPTVLTVTDELTFQVIHTPPDDDRLGRIRIAKQVLLIGTAEDEWIRPTLEERGAPASPSPPQVFRVSNVWSMGQTVTVLLLPSNDPAGVVGELNALNELYDSTFRDWALSRMFISGQDSALADTLRREAGFSVLVPTVYDWWQQDSTYVFRNDNPTPDELIRQVMVSWRPIPLDEPEVERDGVLAWRSELAGALLDPVQEVDTTLIEAGAGEFGGRSGYQLQAIWRNPPSADWPAGGPFITRIVDCPSQDRRYLVDAWLYAPGRDKYEYMIQLETILDSFQCGR